MPLVQSARNLYFPGSSDMCFFINWEAGSFTNKRARAQEGVMIQICNLLWSSLVNGSGGHLKGCSSSFTASQNIIAVSFRALLFLLIISAALLMCTIFYSPRLIHPRNNHLMRWVAMSPTLQMRWSATSKEVLNWPQMAKVSELLSKGFCRSRVGNAGEFPKLSSNC